MELTISGKVAGRLTFELYEDTCPLTCANFKALLTGEKGLSPLSGVDLNYKNSKIHRVWHDYALMGGDITLDDGRGGESATQVPIPDEDLSLKHTGAGLLGMAKVPGIPNSATSQFYITL